MKPQYIYFTGTALLALAAFISDGSIAAIVTSGILLIVYAGAAAIGVNL